MKQVRQSDWAGRNTRKLSAAELAEATRRRMLDACDWMDIPGMVIDQGAWTAYRKALEEAPLQPGWPEQVKWPSPPALPAALARTR